jgi:hypothetical protein
MSQHEDLFNEYGQRRQPAEAFESTGEVAGDNPTDRLDRLADSIDALVRQLQAPQAQPRPPVLTFTQGRASIAGEEAGSLLISTKDGRIICYARRRQPEQRC